MGMCALYGRLCVGPSLVGSTLADSWRLTAETLADFQLAKSPMLQSVGNPNWAGYSQYRLRDKSRLCSGEVMRMSTEDPPV